MHSLETDRKSENVTSMGNGHSAIASPRFLPLFGILDTHTRVWQAQTSIREVGHTGPNSLNHQAVRWPQAQCLRVTRWAESGTHITPFPVACPRHAGLCGAERGRHHYSKERHDSQTATPGLRLIHGDESHKSISVSQRLFCNHYQTDTHTEAKELTLPWRKAHSAEIITLEPPPVPDPLHSKISVFFISTNWATSTCVIMNFMKKKKSAKMTKKNKQLKTEY